MDPRLLRLYNDELAFMRDMGQEFAAAFPKIASRLALRPDEVADPNVERLLEGFAFLAARVQLKLQARFPDFTQHLLEIVYPHFLAPIPSLTIVRFEPDVDGGRLERGYVVPRETVLLGGSAAGSITQCQFKTAHDVHLWPIRVASLDYYMSPSQVSALKVPDVRGVRAVLRLRLTTTNKLPLGRLSMRSLQLHLLAASGIGSLLAEQLLNDTVAMVARPTERPIPWQEVVKPVPIRQVGLEPSEAMLPVVPRSFDGYRLLQEYFALPDRTLFVEIGGLADAVARSSGEDIELLFLLKRAEPRLERHLSAGSVALFTTPAVNLFERDTDRIHLSERVHEHHIVVDRTRPLDFEVHTVLGVRGEGDAQRGSVDFTPFYSIKDTERHSGEGSFYTVRREKRMESTRQKRNGPRTGYVGTETMLSLVDDRAAPFPVEMRQLQTRCLCSNRDLPVLMPVGIDQTDFNMEIGAPVRSVRCLVSPTKPRPSAAEGDVAWKLISHLSLNYLSITDCRDEDRQGADALRQLLRLYGEPTSASISRQIDGVRSVESASVVRRLPGGGQASVARGIEIRLLLDETAFEGIGCFPLAAVLSAFFGKYVSINSFTELTLETPQRGTVARFPISIGRRRLS